MRNEDWLSIEKQITKAILGNFCIVFLDIFVLGENKKL